MKYRKLLILTIAIMLTIVMISGCSLFRKMDDYTALDANNVVSELEGQGYTVVTTYEYSDTIEEGKIVSTSPAAGEKISDDTEIGIVVSNGKGVKVPRCYELKEEDARTLMLNNGLSPIINYVYDDNVDFGKVASTDPTADQIVKSGSSVKINVSLGSTFIFCSDSFMQWYNDKDEWEFYGPYFEEDFIMIECWVEFNKGFTLSNYGKVKLGDEKTLNCSLYHFDYFTPLNDGIEITAKEETKFRIAIPIGADERENKPTEIYVELYGEDNKGNNITIPCLFTATW